MGDALNFIISLVGGEQSLEEFKQKWSDEKTALFETIENDSQNLRLKLVQVFHRAPPIGKKFLVKPNELLVVEGEDDIVSVLEDFDKKGIPGGHKVVQACQKYKLENVAEEVVEYIESLNLGAINGIDVTSSEDESEDEESESEESGADTGSVSGSGSVSASGTGSGSESASDDGSENDSEDDAEGDSDDSVEDDEDGKLKKKHRRKVVIKEIDEPVFAKDPDAVSDDESDEEVAEVSVKTSLTKLGWNSKKKGNGDTPNPSPKTKKKKDDPQEVKVSEATLVYKKLVGLDDELEAWRKEWTANFPALKEEELKNEAHDHSVPIMEVFERLESMDARQFMMTPFEDFILDEPGIVSDMVKELDKLDIPGSDSLHTAVSKFTVQKVIEEVLDYFDLLVQDSMELERRNAAGAVIAEDAKEEVKVEEAGKAEEEGAEAEKPAEIDLNVSHADILDIFKPAFVEHASQPAPMPIQKPEDESNSEDEFFPTETASKASGSKEGSKPEPAFFPDAVPPVVIGKTEQKSKPGPSRPSNSKEIQTIPKNALKPIFQLMLKSNKNEGKKKKGFSLLACFAPRVLD